MQLWEFYHVVSPGIIQEIAKASFDQNAAKTAQQLVIVVARKDLWRKRVRSNIDFLKNQYGNKPEANYSKREKFALDYYQKIIPTLYFDFLGIIGQNGAGKSTTIKMMTGNLIPDSGEILFNGKKINIDDIE